MPIFGGAPGLVFNFEREDETIPGTSNLVLGDAKIVTCFESTGSTCELERQHNAGNWDPVESAEATDIDAVINIARLFYASIEAAQWRIVNTNAADRIVRLSVINVG